MRKTSDMILNYKQAHNDSSNCTLNISLIPYLVLLYTEYCLTVWVYLCTVHINNGFPNLCCVEI